MSCLRGTLCFLSGAGAGLLLTAWAGNLLPRAAARPLAPLGSVQDPSSLSLQNGESNSVSVIGKHCILIMCWLLFEALRINSAVLKQGTCSFSRCGVKGESK